MKTHLFFAIVACLASAFGASGQTNYNPERQREFLDQLLRILPKSEPWEKWLAAKNQLPPDFDSLPSIPYLPDALLSNKGKPVTKDEWPKRRQELLSLFQQYVTGSIPPSPGNVHAADIQSHEEPGCLVDEVLLEFGPKNKARLHAEIIIPKGRPPFPVFITQDNHRAWAVLAVSRGYIGCVYAGADTRDDTGSWTNLWPEHDWSKLTRRAWAASRCIDYLYTLPVVDKPHIALAGHSRNGKTALIGAAMDQRVNAVISSSSGAGGACSWRLFSEAQFGEGIELITRSFPDWFNPKLRFFAGREDKLPIDQPELIACIAPRSCLISSALNDSVESIWANEQTFYSAHRVYEFLGKPQELNLLYRPGSHDTRAENIERYMDWLDAVFGRAPFDFPDPIIFPTYVQWQRLSGEQIDLSIFPTNSPADLLKGVDGQRINTIDDWRLKRSSIRERVLWSFGEAPPFARNGAGKYGVETKSVATLLSRATVPTGLQKESINFGNYISGDLYFPTNANLPGKRLPAVIWLHPLSVSDGYRPGYSRGEAPHLAMAGLGCAVLAFDQIGNGSRLEEVRNFYYRYPHWSLLGKMVEDTLAAVEALSKIEYIDPNRIFLLGYGMGAITALHAGALDDKVAGVISVAGFTPLRTDTADHGTGGIARWSHWFPLQPRLGAFIGQESRIPYDYHELLAMIAPRPALVFTPRIDYTTSPQEIDLCLKAAAPIYEMMNARPRLQWTILEDYNRFSPESQKIVYEKLTASAGLEKSSK